MARNPRWDTEKLSSHAPRPRAREPGASATTGRVEGSRTAAAADGDGPNLLDFPIEAVDELATFAAGSAAGDGGWLAPAGISALLGVEESAPIRSAPVFARSCRSTSTTTTGRGHTYHWLKTHPSLAVCSCLARGGW